MGPGEKVSLEARPGQASWILEGSLVVGFFKLGSAPQVARVHSAFAANHGTTFWGAQAVAATPITDLIDFFSFKGTDLGQTGKSVKPLQHRRVLLTGLGRRCSSFPYSCDSLFASVFCPRARTW